VYCILILTTLGSFLKAYEATHANSEYAWQPWVKELPKLPTGSGVHPLKLMMHNAYSPYFHKIYKLVPYFLKIYTFPPYFRKIYVSWLNLRFLLSPILTMMHLCIILYTYGKAGQDGAHFENIQIVSHRLHEICRTSFNLLLRVGIQALSAKG